MRKFSKAFWLLDDEFDRGNNIETDDAGTRDNETISVSFMIMMDNAQVEKMNKKYEKDQEILEILDQVGHTSCKIIFIISLNLT